MEAENTGELLTREQIDLFPKKVKEDIMFLTENMKGSDIVVFNPLVRELLELRKMSSKLKLKKLSDGSFDKENIQEFVDVKKAVRSYRSAVKKSAKKLKEPYLRIQKGIVSIEKVFIEEATKIFDVAEQEFDDYLKEEERLAKEREEEKNRPLIDAAKEAEKNAQEQRLKNERSLVYNEVKYERIGDMVSSAATNAVLNDNEKVLRSKLEFFNTQTFLGLVKGIDLSKLEESTVKELEEHFDVAIDKAKRIISDKLDQYELERKVNIGGQISSNSIDVPNSPSIPPPPPAFPSGDIPEPNMVQDVPDDTFMQTLRFKVAEISDLIGERIMTKKNCSQDIFRAQKLINELRTKL